MNDLPRSDLVAPLVVGGSVVLAASLVLWGWIAHRLARRQPVLPYEPRRAVPWQGLDLLLVVLFLLLVSDGAAFLDRELFHVAQTPAAELAGARPDLDHPLVVLLREDRSPATLLWCLAAGVVVAPIAEEMLFRLLLQGWVETVERRWRRRLGFLRRLIPGLLPVLVASVAFALLHYREAMPPVNPRWLLHALVRGMVVYLLTIGFALVLVRARVGATMRDLGVSGARFWSDVRLGLLAFLAIMVPVYLMQIALEALLPQWLAPDPITLVFFALALGLLYYRTHRIVPAIVLHMALNATSLALAWFLVTGQ